MKEWFDILTEVCAFIGAVVIIVVFVVVPCSMAFEKIKENRAIRIRAQKASVQRLDYLEEQLSNAYTALLSDFYVKKVDRRILITRDGGKQMAFTCVEDAADYIARRERME